MRAIWGSGTWADAVPDIAAPQEARASVKPLRAGEPENAARLFPLPLRFLLELPEPASGAAAAAVKRDVLSCPLPRFLVRNKEGSVVQWNFEPHPANDVLNDVLILTRRPWEELAETRRPTIERASEDAHALLNLIETWWEYEGTDLWQEIHHGKHGPFNATMPRWRFTSIVEALAYVVLPARGSERGHLPRAATLVKAGSFRSYR